jgi:ubiquinone/menaquinone biosynthesis C-methylase UbiE
MEDPGILRRELFAQAYRVLQPGGLLIMVEGNLQSFIANYKSVEDTKKLLQRELLREGFSRVVIDQAEFFKTKKDMYQFLLSTHKEYDQDSIRKEVKILRISAWK